jgi:hypothetical protein
MRGRRLGQPDAYVDVGLELSTLEGEAMDNDGQLTNRSGADYWRVGASTRLTITASR